MNGRWRTICLLLTAVAAMCSSISGGETTPESSLVDRYQEQYPFISMKDTIYTFETEFELPDGFKRTDPSTLTHFQNWVAHFPLWHRWKAIGKWNGTKMFEFDAVSRGVHLPWVGRGFKDCVIPVRILGEYLLYRNREFDFKMLPPTGDTLRYEDWLKGELRYTARREPFFEPAEKRESSTEEYYKFMVACMDNVSYKSLVGNCDSMSADDLAPGDLFIAHDEKGRKGRVYMVMFVLVNSEGDRLYTVATGCPEACDFHIPLLTDDRDRPWITVEKIRSLAGEFPYSGFFRLRVPK